MGSENSYESEGGLVEVDFARAFQEAVVQSTVLRFKDEGIKRRILDSDPDRLLVVVSTINSPKVIQSVSEYNQSFLENSL